MAKAEQAMAMAEQAAPFGVRPGKSGDRAGWVRRSSRRATVVQASGGRPALTGPRPGVVGGWVFNVNNF